MRSVTAAGAEDQQSVTSIRHSVPVIKVKQKEMAIWAVISELNSIETMRTLSYVCDAFKRLGRAELAEKLWSEAQKEDFYLNPLAKQEVDAHI